MRISLSSIRHTERGRLALVVTILLFVAACAHAPSLAPFPVVGVDPTLTWAAPTTDCTGATVTVTTLRYNVYRVSGPGPIPTIDIAVIGCGTIQQANGTPLNATPLTVTTYNDIAGPGIYTYGVETVDTNGARSGLITKTVTVGGPNAPNALNIN